MMYTFVMFRCVLLLLSILPILAAPASAETSTLRILNQWLVAIDSGDAGKMTEFWKRYSPDSAAEHVAHDQRLGSMTGGLKLVKIIKDDGSHIEVLLKEGRGSYSELTIDLTSSNPPLIRGIFGHPVADPAPGVSSRAANDQELVARVESHVGDPGAKDPFSGAILIAHDGKPVLSRAWGMADSDGKVKNGVNTQFCIGSMNKMFTAVAVLQLVQQGKLSLGGKISDYWPDYPNHDLATRVTIRELLSHTGGTGDIFTPEYEAHRLETRSLSRLCEVEWRSSG